MAGGASADGAVGIGPANTVALDASPLDGGFSLQGHQWIGRSLAAALVILLAKSHLLGSKILVAIDGRPGWRRMPAAQKLLIDLFVTGPAVARRQPGGDDEAVVILALLPGGGLMAIEAIN